MKETLKCGYCGFRFPSIWLHQGSAVQDDRGFFCSVRCQSNKNAEAYGARCMFCSQQVKTPYIHDGKTFCSNRHATLWAMMLARKQE
jgi:endogenous inhibitor of DNA gyrase (YacG/DUF329 family)